MKAKMTKKGTTLLPANLVPERSVTGESFQPHPTKPIHQHDHLKTAHLHQPGICDRYASGLDRNRESRFYFTGKQTTVRVYVNYDESLQHVVEHIPDPGVTMGRAAGKVSMAPGGGKASHGPKVKMSHMVHHNEEKNHGKYDDKTQPVNLTGKLKTLYYNYLLMSFDSSVKPGAIFWDFGYYDL